MLSFLVSCKSTKKDEFSKPIPIKVTGSSRSPRVNLPHYEYPFDVEGNYMAAWAVQGEKRRGRSVAPVKKRSPRRIAREVRKKKRYVAKPAPKAPRVHVVSRGDTLYGLSKRYGSSVQSIRNANRISGSTIYVGQRLKVPR